MTPWRAEELVERLTKAVGGVPPMDLRPRLAALRNGSNHISLRYEWISDFSAIQLIAEKSGWHLSDGQEWFSFFINQS